MKKRRRAGFLAKIESRDDALKIIKDTALGFYMLALVQGVLTVTVNTALWVDAVLVVVLAFWLARSNSRPAAITLFLLSSLVFIVTLLNVPGVQIQGRNAVLGLFMVWVSGRAMEATFKLQGQF